MGLTNVDKKNDDRQIEKLDRIRPCASYAIGSSMKRERERKNATLAMSTTTRTNEKGREKGEDEGIFAYSTRERKNNDRA